MTSELATHMVRAAGTWSMTSWSMTSELAAQELAAHMVRSAGT